MEIDAAQWAQMIATIAANTTALTTAATCIVGWCQAVVVALGAVLFFSVAQTAMRRPHA